MPTVGSNSPNATPMRGSGMSRPVDCDGVPVDGTSGFGAGRLGPGALARDIGGDNDIYENTNTEASPTWVRIDTLPV